MNDLAPIMNTIMVLDRGEAEQPDMTLFDRGVLRTVRYADPVAWTTATAIAHAVAAHAGPMRESRNRVAVFVASTQGPAESIASVAAGTRDGFPSPLRYPAANPGSLVGVTCIAFGFRGPTLNLLAPPDRSVWLGLLMAGHWLNNHTADWAMVAIGHSTPHPPRTRALLLARAGAGPAAGDVSAAANWLGGKV